MATLSIQTHSESADLLALPWHTSLVDWDIPEVVELPKGISRHVVRFVRLDRIYAIKELPRRAARQDYAVLRELETQRAPAVRPVGGSNR